ncbi:MAG TPA: hypothetical protein VNN20_00550, partial [Thermodesulfobacteriota bacterium]|nr:hypothetical protein [Thermodesulfobacteriota bacterium]
MLKKTNVYKTFLYAFRDNIKKCVKVFAGGESFYIFLAEKTKKKGDATHGKAYREEGREIKSN